MELPPASSRLAAASTRARNSSMSPFSAVAVISFRRFSASGIAFFSSGR